ncbi:hypothetical protein BDV25DRAFT_143006 [Aspergillus avenaceus]|uniref:CorA-like transporter domain-containing protein n=1 Tax=Aspergillus avenaceus TaxID=36643 RepID=A0A5N6TLG9_ASPAV|nr:hypothetical protein BDV25DRAFT_143006 [Aspergillus avenaceus]
MASLQPEHYDSIRPHLRHPPFVSNPNQSNIYLFDTKEVSGPKTDGPHVFNNSDTFDVHITKSSRPNARIVSICSQNSMKPLGITEPAMRKLINLYNIDKTFLDLVVSFGDKPQSSDAGHGGMTITHREDGSYDMQYLFAYAEDYNTQGTVAWTIRQVCVFHRYDPTGSGDLWIFLHAKPRSKLQQQIEAEIASQPTGAPPFWYTLHSIVLAAYVGSWRWCIRNLGAEIEKTVDIALTMDLSSTDSARKGLMQLITPQYLGDKLLPLSSRLHATLTTFCMIEEANALFHTRGFATDIEFQKVANEITYYKTNLEGYLESVKVLEGKVKGISDLLAVALNLKNQAVANEINNRMLKLTNESFDDNATVRVVTLVTLIYLPASFVSTVLGMNLVDFEGPNGEGFTVSKQFWIFVVIAVPLTLLTVGSWWVFTRRRLRLQKKRLEEEQMSEKWQETV